MQTQESKKYFRRAARPSRVYVSEEENAYLNSFCSKCRNEKIEYGKTILIWKKGKLCHMYFEDTVPVEIYGSVVTTNEPADKAEYEEPQA